MTDAPSTASVSPTTTAPLRQDRRSAGKVRLITADTALPQWSLA